jgi:hypothetical protein
MTSEGADDDFYAFDITLHGRAAATEDAPRPSSHVDPRGTWPTLAVSRELLTQPMAIGFDEALARLAGLERL